MAFTLSDSLAPELYPLVRLTGVWRGYDTPTYDETALEQTVYQKTTSSHGGGPYLCQAITIWTVSATRSKNFGLETSSFQGASLLAPAQIQFAETTYWRPVGQGQPDSAKTTESTEDGTGTKGSGDPLTLVTQLELTSAGLVGHATVWKGWIQGSRTQVDTQAVSRVRTAVPVEEMARMFELAGDDLVWAQDMAAFGQSEVTTYASGRLDRTDDLDDPAAQPGSALDPTKPEDESSISSDSSVPVSDDAESIV